MKHNLQAAFKGPSYKYTNRKNILTNIDKCNTNVDRYKNKISTNMKHNLKVGFKGSFYKAFLMK